MQVNELTVNVQEIYPRNVAITLSRELPSITGITTDVDLELREREKQTIHVIHVM